MADTLEFLGEIDKKRYFLDLRTKVLGKDGKTKVDNPSYGKVVWKIPDTRESIHAQPGMKILSNDYCIDPLSKILTRDLRWIEAGNTKPGDLVIGFDENTNDRGKGARRNMHTTSILATSPVKLPSVRIITDQGDISCGELHRWLVRSSGTSGILKWMEARNISAGQSIAYFGKPWREDRSYDAGYLSGILDGEGWIIPYTLGFGQNPGVVLDRASDLLTSRGIKFSLSRSLSSDCYQVKLLGGRYEFLKLIGEVRPSRLIENASVAIEDMCVSGRFTKSAKVLAVEKIGEKDLVGIQTGTKTFICDGFLSHNSQVEVRIMAWLSQDPGLIKAINSGQDIHCYFSVDIYGQELGFDYDTINKARKDDTHPRHEELSFIRSGVKTTVFGTPYGASPAKIAQMTGMTEEQAEKFQARYFAKYPDLKRWLDTEGLNALRFGFSTSIRGRKRFYVLPNKNDPEREKILSQIKRWAGNMPIQASNADMLKIAMARIYNAFRTRGWSYEDARILFVVHDEIVCTCREDLAPEVQRIMAEAMHWAFNQCIPVDKMLSGMEIKDAGNILMGTLDLNVVQVDKIWKKD